MGASGLGSTSANLITPSGTGSGGGGGGGGGGGPSGDFSLVLVNLVTPGKHVKKGEVVAEFDRQYQLNRLDDYKDSVVQLDANVKKMKADLSTAKEAHVQLVNSAKSDWDKALLDLKTAEVRSAIEAEKLKLAAEEAEAHYKQLVQETKLVEESQRAQILAAEIDRDKSKIEYDRAVANVDRMVMRAPMDGIVVMQSIWRGGDFGQVQQGDQLWPGRGFMQIVDPSSMILMANLNQVDAESIHLGQKAMVRLDAYAGMQLRAHVVGIAAMTKPGIRRPTYMRELPVRLQLDDPDPRVIPDLSASADITISTEKQAPLVPLSGVFYDNGPRPFVYLQSPSGWKRQEIELGLKTNIAGVVRAGLSAGDVVATAHPDTGKPGS
jgi:HlyD family secretion protein